MKTRAAVAWKAGAPLSIETVHLEGPREGECLVEIKASGVCHTDAFTLSGKDPEGLFPAILGHEGTGSEANASISLFRALSDADRATLAARDGFVHDELRIRQIAAAYRKDNPRAQGRSIRTAIMVIVPETRPRAAYSSADARSHAIRTASCHGIRPP